MIVEINLFVEHRNRTFTLNPDAVTLIHGPSGFGKSTLLQSIPWVLYGGSTSGKKYDVTLRHNGIVIRRYSKPDTLTVTMPDGVTTTGDLAREQIKQIFGEQDLFEACCFLRQGHILLMTRSSKELLFYLSKITFRGEEDPMVLINALKKRIMREEVKYKEQRTIYDASLDHYEAKKIKRPINKETVNVTIDEAKERLATTDQKLLDLHRRIWEYGKLKERYQSLQKENDTLNGRLVSLTSQIAALQKEKIPSREEVRQEQKNIEEEIRKVRDDIIGKKTTLEALQNKVSSRARFVAAETAWAEKQQLKARIDAECLTVPSSFSQQDLYSLQRQWEDYQTLQRLCTTFDIISSADAIQSLRMDATNALTYHTMADRHRNYLKIKTEHTKLREHNIKKMDVDLHHAKLWLESLQCPHCRGQLRYENGKLVALEVQNEALITKETIKKMEHTLLTAQKEMAERERLRIQLESYKDVHNFVTKETMSKDRAEAIIRSFRNVKHVDAPSILLEQGKLLLSYFTHKATPPVHLKEQESFEELEDKIRGHKESLHHLESSLSKLEATLVHLKNQLVIHDKQDVLREQESSLRLLIDQQRNELAAITAQLALDPSVEQERVKKEKERAHEFLDDVNYTLSMVEERNHLKDLYEQVGTLKTAYINSSLLYRYLTRKHYQRLTNTINRLNREIQSLIRDLFVYPMVVRFVAELVSSKTDYSISVTLEVIRKGTEARINRENEISSGERERIAIALMIALAKFHQSPIVLLDEAMARIDANRRDLCIELLKRSLPHRIIVCVEHHADEGMYDHQIAIRPTLPLSVREEIEGETEETAH